MTEGTSTLVSYYPSSGNPVKQEAFDLLDRKYDLEVVHPDRQHELDGVDLYHMAKRTENSLEVLGKAEDRDITTVNSYTGASTANDRLAVRQYLSDKGFNTPRTAYCGDHDIDPPVIAKRRFETSENSHSHSILQNGSIPNERFVEPYLEGEFQKLYYAGGEVRAARKGDQNSVKSDLESEVAAIGEALNMDLYETDVLRTDGDDYIIDVNSTVSMREVPEAAEIYSDLIAEKAAR